MTEVVTGAAAAVAGSWSGERDIVLWSVFFKKFEI